MGQKIEATLPCEGNASRVLSYVSSPFFNSYSFLRCLPCPQLFFPHWPCVPVLIRFLPTLRHGVLPFHSFRQILRAAGLDLRWEEATGLARLLHRGGLLVRSRTATASKQCGPTTVAPRAALLALRDLRVPLGIGPRVVGDAMRAVVVGDAMRAVVDGMKTTAAFLDDTAVTVVAVAVAVVTVAVAVALAPDRLLCAHSASPLGRLLRLRLRLRLLLRLLLQLRLRLRLRLLLFLGLYLRQCLLPPFQSL